MHEKLLSSPFRRRGPGFTLIELLTVIAIIGILAAILIPTVGKVRMMASKSTTTSNYRQVGIAIMNFAADNRDQMPGIYRPGLPVGQYNLVGGQTAYARDHTTGYKYLVHPLQVGRYLNSAMAPVAGENRYYSPMLESPVVRNRYPDQVVKCAQLGRQVVGDDGQTYHPFGWDSPAKVSLKYSQLAKLFPHSKRWMMRDDAPEGEPWVSDALHGNSFVVLYYDGHVASVPNNKAEWDANNDGQLPES